MIDYGDETYMAYVSERLRSCELAISILSQQREDGPVLDFRRWDALSIALDAVEREKSRLQQLQAAIYSQLEGE